MANIKKLQAMAQRAMGKLPLKNERIDQITKVTFETEDGRKFTVFGARVWELNLQGNLAYQIRGDQLLSLNEVLPAKVETATEQPDEQKGQ